MKFFSIGSLSHLVLSNVTANANNWTGGLIIDGANNDSSYVHLGTNNQVAGNNLTLIQAGTSIARFDLTGFSDTIGYLNGGNSANNQVFNSGTAPSVLTLGAGNASGSFGGVIGGDVAPNTLSIVKIGTGTETLSNANTYVGNTLIQGGTLALGGNGSLATPSILVSNATFDISSASSYSGSASIGLMSNAVLNVGPVLASIAGSGNFAMTNSTLFLSVNSGSPSLTVAGTFATSGQTNSVNVISLPGFASYPQQLRIIQYGAADSNLVDANNNLKALTVTLPGSFTYYLTNNTSGNSIDLVLVSGPIATVQPVTWSGQTNGVNVGNWDIFITSNWVVTADGVTPYYYVDTDAVTFDDTLHGTTNVVLKATLLPASITMNNSQSNYVFSGTGKISGTTGLTANGNGTLTLKETGGDNFSGGITVNAGTVIIDNNSANVSGGTTINSGTVQVGNNDTNGFLPSGSLTVNGTLAFARTDAALSVGNGNISGGGMLVQKGSGTLTVIGNNPLFTGTVTVNSGTLALNGPNAASSTISHAASLTINTNSTTLVVSDNSLGISPGLPITINAGGVLTGLGTADGGSGPSSHIAGLLTLQGGTLAMNGTQNGAFGSWNLDGGVSLPGMPFTSTISALNVVPHQAGGTIFNVVSGGTPSGIDLLVGGTLNNASSAADTGIIKQGSGVMVLDNNNTFSHTTIVSGGTLQLGLPGDTAALVTPLGAATIANTVSIQNNSILKFASSKGVTVGNPISDDGTGTVLSSSGTNILTQANTYTGNTIVTAGKLVLTGAGSINNSGNIQVSNAQLDVSSGTPVESTGNLMLTSSTFNLGTNLVTSIGSLSITNTKLIFGVNFGVNVFTNIIVNNALVVAGSTNTINITSVPGYPFYPTNIPLVHYASFANVGGGNNLTNLGWFCRRWEARWAI